MKKQINYLFILAMMLVSLNNSIAQSTDLDRKIGIENSKIVEAQMGIYDDVEKTEFIRKVGQRLLANLDNRIFDYEFHIVPAVEPNAFALPGGYIYITTGLLPLIQTEDELACIMAHEIIHAHKRHTIRQIKKSLLPKLFEIPGNLIGVVNQDLGDAFNAPIKTSNALVMASYGRDFETESDIEGIKLAAASGYDPAAMVPVLSRMSAAIESATGQSESKSYFNDHPYTPDRIVAINKHVKKISWSAKNPIANNFLIELDSLLFGDSPSLGVIQEQRFLHPDLDFTIEFPANWDIDNQPSSIGAYNPARSSAVFLTLEGPGITPQVAANRLVKELNPEYKEKLIGVEAYTIGGKDGMLVSFEDDNYSETVYAYVLFIPLDGELFKLSGITTSKYKPQLEETAMSLRVLNEQERSSFKINLVRVVNSEKGESINTIGKRFGNRLNDELTAIINGKDINMSLQAHEEIKVVKQYSYRSKEN